MKTVRIVLEGKGKIRKFGITFTFPVKWTLDAPANEPTPTKLDFKLGYIEGTTTVTVKE